MVRVGSQGQILPNPGGVVVSLGRWAGWAARVKFCQARSRGRDLRRGLLVLLRDRDLFLRGAFSFFLLKINTSEQNLLRYNGKRATQILGALRYLLRNLNLSTSFDSRHREGGEETLVWSWKDVRQPGVSVPSTGVFARRTDHLPTLQLARLQALLQHVPLRASLL